MHVSIVNDAAWVGYELSKVLRKRGVYVRYLPRRRTIWGKTFGALRNSLMATGIIHVNYALQDAFLVRAIHGKIDILHTHGSDVRSSMKTKQWGWMVSNNLHKARKVLVSTPDILPLVRQVRKDAQYLPNPIDIIRFKPVDKPVKQFSCIYIRHNYEPFPEDLAKILLNKKIPLFEISTGSYSYFEMDKIYSKFSVFIDRFSIDSFSKSCLESMACGLATLDYRHKEQFAERVESLLDVHYRSNEGQSNRKYIVENHDASKVCNELLKIYDEVS